MTEETTKIHILLAINLAILLGSIAFLPFLNSLQPEFFEMLPVTSPLILYSLIFIIFPFLSLYFILISSNVKNKKILLNLSFILLKMYLAVVLVFIVSIFILFLSSLTISVNKIFVESLDLVIIIISALFMLILASLDNIINFFQTRKSK